MITRTTRYTASDGTEHDRPQEAAQHNLAQQIRAIGVEAMGCTYYEQLARNPEALRDALDAYFEDLEEHPDMDERFVPDPEVLREMVKDGVLGVATPEEALRGTSCDDPLNVFDGTTRGFEFDLATGSSQSFEIKEDGTFTTNEEATFQVTGIPTTWQEDMPVDHPQYCRPFGTRED